MTTLAHSPDIPSLPPPYFSVGQPPPAVPARRIQRRPRRPAAKVKINSQTDLEVWDKTDEEICNAALASYTSWVYGHYKMRLCRHTRPDPSGDGTVPDYLEYEFICKTDPDRHPPQFRRCSETHRGTGNLKASLEACQARNNESNDNLTATSSTPFSYAMHLALIVMMCAYHYLPFAGVLHDLIRRHVQLLRPGTSMPDSTTLSRTTRHVYEKQGEKVRAYFNAIDTIHLAIDGWTSPTATAYLGLVVHWYSEGQMWRAVLEMIRLEQKHTGEYLAQTTAECLWRYGLGSKLRTVCMDNASNNDTFTRRLPTLIPGFRGPQSRVRCAAHVLNLVVKAFTAYFMTATNRKRKAAAPKSKLTRKRRRGNKSSTDKDSDNYEAILIEGDGDSAEVESEDEAEAPSASAVPDNIDAAKALHDENIIKSTMESALAYARTQLGLNISEVIQTAAQGVITMASKLAKKVHESPRLKHELSVCIERVALQLNTNRRSLARRVATRWNSDYDCLQSIIDLRICVEMLIEDSANDLDNLRFSEYQWKLIDQLVRILKIFKEATRLFSQSGVPLVHEVVPIFVRISRKLKRIRDDPSLDLEPIIRVAAHSSLLVIDKYMNLFEESEVYWIALVMCPNYKLQWLRDNGFSEADIETVRNLVANRFNATFASDTGEPAPFRLSETEGESDDEWELGGSSGGETTHAFDSIEDYLQTEPVSSMVIKASGGPLKHWHSQLEPTARPRLARFAIDYLSAPASSVDAERAFSCGRLTINHLQHQMSPDTFCAKMALRSWYGTPLLNGVEEVALLLEGGLGERLSVD